MQLTRRVIKRARSEGKLGYKRRRNTALRAVYCTVLTSDSDSRSSGVFVRDIAGIFALLRANTRSRSRRAYTPDIGSRYIARSWCH